LIEAIEIKISFDYSGSPPEIKIDGQKRTDGAAVALINGTAVRL
jgi:hypothetical protein